MTVDELRQRLRRGQISEEEAARLMDTEVWHQFTKWLGAEVDKYIARRWGRKRKCTCGAAAVKSKIHSSWCDVEAA